MFAVTVTLTGAGNVVVALPSQLVASTTEAEDKGPSPIAPEVKELIWGGGAFIVLFVLMQTILFPRLKKGMDARHDKIRNDHQSASSMRDEATAELAAYEADLASVKAEAAKRLDAARQTLEAERSSALAEAGSRIAVQRGETVAANDAARAAAAHHIRAAVADVSGRAAELATGHRPDPSNVDAVVAGLMGVGK